MLQAGLIVGGLLLVLALGAPFAIVGTGHVERVLATISSASLRRRLVLADMMRPYTMAKDPSITPLRAGEALTALSGAEHSSSYAFRVVRRDTGAWVNEELTPEMFKTAPPREFKNLPASDRIIAVAAEGKLSREEMDFLERVAHDPLWRDVELVGRAEGVDFLGARFVVPFPDSVNAFELPTPHFSAIRAIAHAGASRAAWYAARGQRDSAESSLHAVNSLGFAMMDNATDAFDQIIGAVIVGIGREALIQLYTTGHDPRGARLRHAADSIKAAPDSSPDRNGTHPALTLDRVIASVGDTTVPRGLRYSLLRQLALAPCLSVRGVVTGSAPGVDSTFAWARRSLARYPSDAALIDLIRVSADRPHDFAALDSHGPLLGAAALSSSLLHSPRLLNCSAIAMIGR